MIFYKENTVMGWYEIPGQETDNAIIESKRIAPEKCNYYQLNFKVAYADLLEVKSGISPDAQVVSITFRGIFASDLHGGMEKSGLTPVGFSYDEQGNRAGYWYRDGRLFCAKYATGVSPGTSCTLTFGNVQ